MPHSLTLAGQQLTQHPGDPPEPQPRDGGVHGHQGQGDDAVAAQRHQHPFKVRPRDEGLEPAAHHREVADVVRAERYKKNRKVKVGV